MTRTLQDGNLEVWEAYASSGDHGFPARSRIVFTCLSDRARRPRVVSRERDKADVEKEVAALTEDALRSLLAGAVELK